MRIPPQLVNSWACSDAGSCTPSAPLRAPSWHLRIAPLLLVSCLAVTGCGDDEGGEDDETTEDAGGGHDSGSQRDARVDSATQDPEDDADTEEEDAGEEPDANELDADLSDAATEDAGHELDAGDAATDAGSDAATDSGGDAGTDAGDAATDAGDLGTDAAVLPAVVENKQIVVVSATGHDRFYGVTYDAAGNIYAVGQVWDTTVATGDIGTVVAKFTKTGALDTSFGTRGFVLRNVVAAGNGELFRGIVVQSTGKIVISGAVEHLGAGVDARDRDIALLRFNADGTTDQGFGNAGVLTLDLSTGVANGTGFSADSAWGLERYADDRLVVSGGQVRNAVGAVDTDFALVRLSADGARDATFGTNGVFTLDTQVAGASRNASPRNLTILPGTDGIIGAGYQPAVDPAADTRPAVYKVSDTGVLVTSFGTNGVFDTQVFAEQTECYQAAVQRDATGTGYKLVTTGYGRSLSTETTDLVSLRLTSNGVLDTTYGTHGAVRIDVGGFGDNSRRVLVLPDRRVVLSGGGRLTSADVDGLIAILTPDGAPYTPFATKGFRTFDLGGPADFLWSVALSPDSRALAAVGIKGVGTAAGVNGNDDAALLVLPVPN